MSPSISEVIFTVAIKAATAGAAGTASEGEDCERTWAEEECKLKPNARSAQMMPRKIRKGTEGPRSAWSLRKAATSKTLTSVRERPRLELH